MSLEQYREHLAEPRFAEANQPWLAQHRRHAVEQLQRLGFPQRRQEAWRYTSVERLLKQTFVPADRKVPHIDIEAVRLPQLDAYRIVFVNGNFVDALSDLKGLPPGVTAGSLKQQISENPILPARWLGSAAGEPAHAFSALNTAAIEDGLFIHVARGKRPDRPIEVLHLTTAPVDAVMAQSRNLVLLEAGAKATLIERFAGIGTIPYFNNGLSEITLQDGAELEHYRLQEESPAAYHLHSLFISQYAQSRYANTGFSLGGAWSRTELSLDFLGEAATAGFDGLYLAGEQQLSDVHLDIRHGVPGCASQTNYRGLLHGRGRAVFDGRIEVKAHADGSEAHLNNANLLLSRNAEVDTKPQLEIHADDVKCSHGATVGQLDPAQLFYLRSRGIDADEAKRLLCLGFAGGVLDRCGIAPLRERVEAVVSERLAMALPDDGGRN
jgi:Fe-S cluster assembly protein SufD